jgi:hypothetical protein
MAKTMSTNGTGRIAFLHSYFWRRASQNTVVGRALNMDGQSGIFFQPCADVAPGPTHRFGAPTMDFHVVDAGPVAGDYVNVGVEEGFGNRLEFGFARSNDTDGGDPTISPLFNFAGMNMFNIKAKLVPAAAHKLKYVPAISVSGVLRTNDPFVVQSVQHTNASNGDVYSVATELFTFGKKLAFLANARVRGTNAQKYGYGGNTLDWEARAFGGLAFPISVKKAILIEKTIEVDQEPTGIKYVPARSSPDRPHLCGESFPIPGLQMDL